MFKTSSVTCACALVVAAPAAAGTLTERVEREDAPVSLSLSMQPLVDHFNAGRGKPRFVAIVSSTCPACVFGAKAVKASVLDAYPDTDIQVSIVWIDMLPSDNEGAARKSSAIFKDEPRVRQFYDPNQRTGRAFARGLLNKGGGVAWDIYLYYDKDALWQDTLPEPVEWFHQLGGGRRADANKFRPGDKLTAALKKATGLFMIVSVSTDPTVGPRLQVLSFEGCPNAGILSASLEEACAQVGLPVSLIEQVNLADLDDDDPRRGWGSPTILVDGADLMGLEPPAGAAISCRIYPGNTLPTARQIAERLRRQ